jgi:hypothetical protein
MLLMYIMLPLLLEYGLQDVQVIILLGTTVVFSNEVTYCPNLHLHVIVYYSTS